MGEHEVHVTNPESVEGASGRGPSFIAGAISVSPPIPAEAAEEFCRVIAEFEGVKAEQGVTQDKNSTLFHISGYDGERVGTIMSYLSGLLIAAYSDEK